MGIDNETLDEKWILIVDDVETNRFVLRNIIVDMGHKPMLAENGVQAFKIIERNKPNLILLDVSMPEMDGYELCSKLKANAETKDIPIIFISAFDETDDIIKGFEIGGDDYITKPFIMEVVQARVNVLLQIASVRGELQDANKKLASSVNEQIKQIDDERRNVLLALASVARENAKYEDNYLERLQNNSRMLAQAMQLSPEYENQISDSFVETMSIAAPLSDLGNVAVPSEILQKEGKLTEEEFEQMEAHTTIGARILQDIFDKNSYNDYLKLAIDVAHFHHENWDGTGYPTQISGTEIPISAQIVAIVAAYCALTEDRAYRKAYSPEDTVKIIELESGRKFNPNIVNILKVVYRQFS